MFLVVTVTMLEAIVDYHNDNATVDVADKYVITPKGGESYE